MMHVLGVDQSYTGFGLSDGTRTTKTSFPIAKYRGPVHRLVEIQMWWCDRLQKYLETELVAMEGYSFGSKQGREISGELGGIVKTSVWDILGENALIIIPPNTLKKFVTGRGNAKKSEMLLGVYKRWDEEFTDDNMADAFALAKFAQAFLGETEGLTVAQQKVVEDFQHKG